MDYILPGSCVNGIHQTRMLEWIAIPSLGKEPTSLSLGLPHWQAGSLPLAPRRKPRTVPKTQEWLNRVRSWTMTQRGDQKQGVELVEF